jgi:aspartate ammonia-lyase
MRVLQTRCVAGILADEARCRELLDRSTALATALSPYIGYAETADIAKAAVKTGRSIRDIVRERQLLPDAQLDAILSVHAMTTPGVPGAKTGAQRAPRAGRHPARTAAAAKPKRGRR